jgi:hypothetical protein
MALRARHVMSNMLALTSDKKKTVQFTGFTGTNVQILTPEEVRARHVMANMLALISDNKKTVRDAVLAWYLVYLLQWSKNTNTDSRGAACQPLRLVRAHRGRHSDVC